MPLIVPPSSIVEGQLSFYWIQANGLQRDLNKATSPVWVPKGTAGLGAQTFEIDDVKFPNQPGSAVQHIRTPPREFEVPIVINRDTLGELLVSAEDVHDWFFTGDEETRSPGIWKVVRPDGTIRHLECYYLRGLEGNMGEGGPNWFLYTVEFFAPEVAPTDPEDTLVSKTLAQSANFTVINQGRLHAFPVWKLYGPFTAVVLRNTSYDPDKLFTMTTTIVNGEYIIVDTRPSNKRSTVSVYDQAGTNRMAGVAPASEYWRLQAGSNNIQITFTGGTSGQTRVELTYLARYRSMLR